MGGGDAEDFNDNWITEIWVNFESYHAAFQLAAVNAAIAEALLLISAFEKIAATNPMGGIGLPASQHMLVGQSFLR